MVNKTIKFMPLFIMIVVSLSIGTLAYTSMSLGKGIRYYTYDGGAIYFDLDITTSCLYYTGDYLMFNKLNGIFSSIGFFCQTENANLTITKISLSEICLTVDAPAETVSTTKIYSPIIVKPKDVTGCTSWAYSIFTKTITINVLHQSPSDITISWLSSDVITDSILKGSLILGIVEYYTTTIGTVPFFGLMVFGITILAYIWTQSIDFIAVIWLIIGGALEIYIPGPALTIGKVLMILGIFVIFVKVILGRREYG